jgi:hypothetical protein
VTKHILPKTKHARAYSFLNPLSPSSSQLTLRPYDHHHVAGHPTTIALTVTDHQLRTVNHLKGNFASNSKP